MGMCANGSVKTNMTFEALSKALKRLHVTLVSVNNERPKEKAVGKRKLPKVEGKAVEEAVKEAVKKAVKEAVSYIQLLNDYYDSIPYNSEDKNITLDTTIPIYDANYIAMLNDLDSYVYKQMNGHHIWEVLESKHDVYEFEPSEECMTMHRYPWIEVWKQRMRRREKQETRNPYEQCKDWDDSNPYKHDDHWVASVVTELLKIQNSWNTIMGDSNQYNLSLEKVTTFEQLCDLNIPHLKFKDEDDCNGVIPPRVADDLIKSRSEIKRAFDTFAILCDEYLKEYKTSIFKELSEVFKVKYTPWGDLQKEYNTYTAARA